MRAKYARTIRAGIELARMGWRGDAIIPTYIGNPLLVVAFAHERGNMRRRVSPVTSRRVSAVEPFRVQRNARTGVRASDAILGRSVKLMYEERQQ